MAANYPRTSSTLFFCLNCRRDYPIADKRKWRGQVRCASCCDRAAHADRLRIIKAAADALQKTLADRENNA